MVYNNRTPGTDFWQVHRIVTSKYYRASLVEVQTEWSLDDVADAHEALDYFDRLEWVKMKALRKI